MTNGQRPSRFTSALAYAANYARPVVAAAVYKGGRLVQSTVIKSIKNQSVGETVTRIKPGQAPSDHVASKPGDAPNTDTGELIRGIQIEITGADIFVGVESSQERESFGSGVRQVGWQFRGPPLFIPCARSEPKAYTRYGFRRAGRTSLRGLTMLNGLQVAFIC